MVVVVVSPPFLVVAAVAVGPAVVVVASVVGADAPELSPPQAARVRATAARSAGGHRRRLAVRPVVVAVEQAFLDASAEQAASERRALESRARRDAWNNRRLVALLGALALLLTAAVAVGAIAIRESQQAHRAGDAATARGLAAAAAANVAIDPERSILLALEAVEHARSADSSTLHEAEEALHRAVSATRIEWRVTGTGGALDWSPDGSHVVTEGLQSSGAHRHSRRRDRRVGPVVRGLRRRSHRRDLRPHGHAAGHHQRRRDRCGVGQHHRRAPARHGRPRRRAGMGPFVQPGRATLCRRLASRRRRPRADHARLDGRDHPRAPRGPGRGEHVVLPRWHQARRLVRHRTDRRHHRRRVGRRAAHPRRKPDDPHRGGVEPGRRTGRDNGRRRGPRLRRDVRSTRDGARRPRILRRGHRLEPRLDPAGHHQRRRHGEDLEPR